MADLGGAAALHVALLKRYVRGCGKSHRHGVDGRLLRDGRLPEK